MEKLSERIKELRIKNQYSIEQLSKLTNISKSSLCRYENNQSDIKAEQIVILAKFFKVSCDYLLGLEDWNKKKSACESALHKRGRFASGFFIECFRFWFWWFCKGWWFCQCQCRWLWFDNSEQTVKVWHGEICQVHWKRRPEAELVFRQLIGW